MPTAFRRTLVVAMCCTSLCLFGSAFAQDAATSELTPQGAEAHAARVRAARSAREAGPSLLALRAGGAAGLQQLRVLLDSEVLVPEVRYHTVVQALQSDAPGAADLAIGFITDEDFDIQLAALRQLGNHAQPKHVDRLLALAKVERNEDAMIFILSALGVAGDPRVAPFLESFLVKGGKVKLIHGAAFGLGALKSENSAGKLLQVIDETYPIAYRDSLLLYAHQALGSPEDVDRVVAAAKTPGPLRLWGVERLKWFTVETDAAVPRSAAVRKAAQAALSDPNPVIRERAAQAVAACEAGHFPFLYDETAVQTLANLKSDSSALVRAGLIDALHETAMRRGLSVPGATPLRLEGHTMRMLRWPADWIVFPTLIGLLDDPMEEVRVKAAWMLGISTGYWYGYDDIRLLGTPHISLQTKHLYTEMWNAMKDKSPRAVTIEILDDVVNRLEKGDSAEAHGQWFLGVRLLTGRDFGWRGDADAATKTKAITALATWWSENREKEPALWIIDSVREEGFKVVDDYNFHILARSGLGNPPRGLNDRKVRAENPTEILRKLEEWWTSASDKH